MPIRLKPRFRLTPASPAVKRVRSPKMPQRLGDRATSDFIHNCVTCSRWVGCVDNQRGVSYRCTRYREATTDIQSLEELLDTSVFDTDQFVADENIFNAASGSEVDIQAMIEAVINSNVPVPPDLRINDSDIPEAANFNEWATSAKFAGAGMPPFPRQLEIGTKLLGEFCPRCSDNDWFDEMRVDASLAEIHDRVTFLKHGKCPECKITKSELVLNKELLDYTDLIAVCGQRSGKTTSVNLWEGYNLHKFLKLSNPASVYGLLPSQILISTPTALTFAQAVTNVWNPFSNILTETPWFCLAEGSKITMAGGNCKNIEDVVRGDKVKTLDGAAEVLQNFDNGVKDTVIIELEDNRTLRSTKEHKIRIFDEETGELIWVLAGDLKPEDLVVIE